MIMVSRSTPGIKSEQRQWISERYHSAKHRASMFDGRLSTLDPNVVESYVTARAEELFWREAGKIAEEPKLSAARIYAWMTDYIVETIREATRQIHAYNLGPISDAIVTVRETAKITAANDLHRELLQWEAESCCDS